MASSRTVNRQRKVTMLKGIFDDTLALLMFEAKRRDLLSMADLKKIALKVNDMRKMVERGSKALPLPE